MSFVVDANYPIDTYSLLIGASIILIAAAVTVRRVH